MSHFYLIKNNINQIVGRMNLVNIDKKENLAHVGYRIGENYIGKRIATKALKLLLEESQQFGIEKIKAKTTTNNLASQKTLQNNDFKRISVSNDEYDMNGKKVKFVYYSWGR
ncbi:GNAT family N-acetyltransferase [Bacillus carboniphilus]|uniref:GNAT family N-acetyltransferase n=1 Tax=Bacillus carboniphilus TaxID=86663 RepID=UPI0035324173